MDLVPKGQLMYYIDPGWEVIASSSPVRCPPPPLPPSFSAFIQVFTSFVKLKDFLVLPLFFIWLVVVFGEYSGQQKTLWANIQKSSPTVDITASSTVDFATSPKGWK